MNTRTQNHLKPGLKFKIQNSEFKIIFILDPAKAIFPAFTPNSKLNTKH